MNSAQKQDLVLFSDHSVISKSMCNGDSHDLIFITNSAVTSPGWLINAFVETSIFGLPYSLKSETNTGNAPAPGNMDRNNMITICSFLHDSNFIENSLMKLKISPNKYNMIDCVTGFVLESIGKPNEMILKKLVEKFPNNNKSTILLEQPEMLLSLLDGLTSDDLQKHFVVPLMKRCGLLIVSSSIELMAVVEQKMDSSLEDIVVEFKRYILAMIYKSIAVINLKPLDTGRAKDISGSLRITRGGQNMTGANIHVVENEYLYLRKKDSTKLFYR